MNSFPAMEWNAKWDWENLDIFSSKACGSPKKVHVSDWGIEGGDIDAGSYNLSGGYGGYTSDVGYVSSAKSSVSASTDCSSKEGMNASNFTFDSFGGFLGDLGKKKDLATAEINVTSPSLETSIGSGDLLIGLKLGKRTYFENSVGNSAKTSHLPVNPVSTAPMANKIRSTCQNTTTPRCQVEGCNLDLSSAKEYHRKHRVCASHSKCPEVVVRGLERRFCQQCSRFHSLSEFDQKKRSCRRRLSDHNARRRKPQQETIQFNAASLSSSIYEGTHQMSFVLNNAPLAHTRPAGSQAWESTCRSNYKLAKGCLVKPQKAGVIDLQPHLPGSKLPYAISLPNYDTSRLLQSKGSAETFSQGFRESMLSCTDAAPDLCSARSLLSTNNSWGSCDQGSLMNVTHASMPQGLPFAPPECWQALATNGNGGNHYQEIQFGSGFYSHSMN